MSNKVYTIYGYGICVDDIFPIVGENIWQLLDLAPKTKKKFTDFLLDNNYGDEIELCHILLDYENEFAETGLGVLLQEAILEGENLNLFVGSDYDGVQYLLFTPDYPWRCKDNKNLKEEDIVAVIGRYVRTLTDKPIDIDYYEFEM